MDKIPIDRFFHYASRFVIVVPIVTVALVLLFAKNPFEKAQNLNIPTPTENKPEEIKEQFDINGSYVCQISKKNASTEAYLKNKSLYLETTEKVGTKYTLFIKDCLYSWQKRKSIGEKTCGLSQYISMAENLSKMNLLDPDSFIEKILGEKISFSQACKEQEIKDNKIFKVPKNINFKEKKLQ